MDVKLDQKLVFLIFHLIVMLETRGGRDKKLQDYLGVTKPFFNPDTSTTVRVNIFSEMKYIFFFTTCIQNRHASYLSLCPMVQGRHKMLAKVSPSKQKQQTCTTKLLLSFKCLLLNKFLLSMQTKGKSFPRFICLQK